MGSTTLAPGAGSHTGGHGAGLRHALGAEAFRVPCIMGGAALVALGSAGILHRSGVLAGVAVGLSVCGAALVGLGVPRRRVPGDAGARPTGVPESGLPHARGQRQRAGETDLTSSVRWRGRLYLGIGLVTGAIAVWDSLAAADLTDRVAAALRILAAAAACWAGWLLLRPPASRWTGIGGGLASLIIVAEYWRLSFNDRWIDWRPTVAFLLTDLLLLAVVVAVVISSVCERWVNPLPGQQLLAGRIEVGLAVIALVGTLLAAVLQIGGGWYTTTHNPAQTHPNLTVTVDFAEATNLSDLTVVPVQIGIRNGGQVGLDLLMTQYTVVGFDLRGGESTSRPPGRWDPLVGAEAHDFAGSRSWRATRSCPTVLQYGRVTETKTNLGPGEEKSTRVLVALPGGTAGAPAFDGIQVLVHAAAAREFEFRLVDEEPLFWTPRATAGRTLLDHSEVSGMKAGLVYAAWRIERSTLRAALASAPREVRVGWKLPPDPGAQDRTCPGGLPEPEPHVLFAYAADNELAREANDQLESKYDPFYVLTAADRLVAETGDTQETSSPGPPLTEGRGSPSPAR